MRGERKKSGDARRGPLLAHCSLLITCMHDAPSSRVRFSVERTDSVEEFRSIDSSLQSIPACNPFQHALEFAVSPRRLTPSHSDGSLARWLAMIASRGVPSRNRQPAGTNHRRARVPPALGDHAYARQLNRLCRAPAAALDSSAAVRSRRTSAAVGGGEPARVESRSESVRAHPWPTAASSLALDSVRPVRQVSLGLLRTPLGNPARNLECVAPSSPRQTFLLNHPQQLRIRSATDTAAPPAET